MSTGIFDAAIFDPAIFDTGAVAHRGGGGGGPTSVAKPFDRIKHEDEELLTMIPCFIEVMRHWH